MKADDLFQGIVKTTSIVLLIVLTLITGLWPLNTAGFSYGQKLISFGNSFCAGQYLAISFLHLLPTSILDFQGKTSSRYSFACLFSLISYWVIMVIDRVIVGQNRNSQGTLISPGNQELSKSLTSNVTQEVYQNNERSNSQSNTTERSRRRGRQGNSAVSFLGDKPINSNDAASMMYEVHDDYQQYKKKRKEGLSVVTSPDDQVNLQESSINDYAFIAHFQGRQTSMLTILLALIYHSIIEGIAIGLQDDVPSTIYILLAVILHQVVQSISFAQFMLVQFIGVQKSAVCMIIFSLASPLGVGIGWVVHYYADRNEKENGSYPVNASFNAIAAGTLLYIGASELVIEQFSSRKNIFVQFLAFTSAILLISTLWISFKQLEDI